MKWVNLVTAAIFAGYLVAVHKDDLHSFFAAVGGVLAFGLFLDDCLERRLP